MHRDMFCWLLREKTGFHGVITARFLQNASGITAASFIMSGVDMLLSDFGAGASREFGRNYLRF